MDRTYGDEIGVSAMFAPTKASVAVSGDDDRERRPMLLTGIPLQSLSFDMILALSEIFSSFAGDGKLFIKAVSV